MITIYTDGACSGNPGLGGWGAVILEETKKPILLNGGEANTTNNRMELLAIIIALESLKIEPMEVMVFSDSKYVVDSVDKKWVFSWEKKQFKGKKNSDLWKRYLLMHRKHNVSFKWIKGHNKHLQNERCDQLALNAAKRKNKKIDLYYEKIEKGISKP